MVCRLLPALALLSILLAGADATAAFNEACPTGTTCTDTTNNVCDTNRLTPLCKVIATKTCTKDDDCVAGSKCAGSPLVCAPCDSTVSTSSSSLCNPKTGYIGATCDDANPCTTGNSECSSTKCACKSGYTTNYATFSCNSGARIISKMTGFVTVLAAIYLGLHL